MRNRMGRRRLRPLWRRRRPNPARALVLLLVIAAIGLAAAWALR